MKTRQTPQFVSCITIALFCLVCGIADGEPCLGQSRFDTGGTTQADTASSLSEVLVSASASDADLNSIAVVSADRLCAVGNCGAILLSENGGRSWSLVASPTIANLHAVAFFDASHGVAVGGTIGNYTRASRAVILRTIDGGRSWQLVRSDLPRLLGIRIESAQSTVGSQALSKAPSGAVRVLCWGDFSTKYKTGVFESSTNGATWRAANILLGHVTAAGVSPDGTVAAVDLRGRISVGSTVRDQPLVAKKVRCLHHTGRFWLACGARGELTTSIGGTNWSNVDLPLSSTATRLCKWKTIAQVGNDVWVGGSPGSILLHSPDRGASWSVRPTGQSLPISQVKFLDQHRGWSVGPFGRILATRDGGQNWYAQRHGNKRPSVLSVASAPDSVPWSPLVAVSWDHRRLVTSIVYDHRTSGEQTGFLPNRWSQLRSIAPQLGISAFTIKPSAVSDEEVALQVATILLTWRPNVVLTDETTRTSDSSNVGLDANAHPQTVYPAVYPAMQIAQAAVGSRAEALDELALSPWSVDKLVVVTDSENQQYSEQSARVLKTLGIAVWDVLLRLPPDQRKHAETIAMRTQWSKTHNRSAGTSLLGGVPPDKNTARNLSINELGNYQLLMGRVHRRKSVEQLIDYRGSDDSWENDLNFVVANLPSQELEPVLFELAGRLAKPEYAHRREYVLRRLTTLRSGGDAAVWAMLELLQLNASDEIEAWYRSHEARKEPVPIELAARTNSGNPGAKSRSLDSKPWNATPFGQGKRTSPGSSAVVRASATREKVAFSDRRRDDWFQLYRRFARMAPSIVERPDLRILSYRMAGRLHHAAPVRTEPHPPTPESPSREVPAREGEAPPEPGPSDIPPLAIAPPAIVPLLAGWPQVADQEARLARNEFADHHLPAMAAWADTKPVLDGQLDEALWNAVPAMQLSSQNENDPTTSLHLAYDRRYLYISLECPLAVGDDATPIKRIRTYDSNLDAVDHIQISLDTDRDYCTAIELAVAEDGRTYDRCCGWKEYDPKWYVQVASREGMWTAEIAIELKYLTTKSVLVGEAWAISARRVRPAQPLQSWSGTRSLPSQPEGMGLLLFLPGR